MSLILLAPAALAALATLLLALLIHLARRSEQRPTDFAALRWLRQKPKPRHRLRFDEWPLLLLRLLLLALLALGLARPMLEGSASHAPWVAVAPGIGATAARNTIADEEARLHWLAPAWPALDQPAPQGIQPIASLLRQLDAELPPEVPLTVLVPEVLQGVDAQRPRLSRAVDWRVLPGEMPAPTQATPAPVSTLAVRHAPGQEDAVRYLRAAAGAWQEAADADAEPPAADVDAALSDVPLASGTRWLAWLAPGAVPPAVEAWIADGGTALLGAETTFDSAAPGVVAWRDTLGQPLVQASAHGQGRVLQLAREFTPARMPQLMEADFPRQLRALLQTPPPAPARVAARDYTPTLGGESYPQSPRELQPWLALLIVLVLLIERWVATRRRRGVSP